MFINEKAVLIIEKLHKAGFEAYVVGGCVRDSILGKEPKDWDICTNAKTEQIMQVFEGFNIIPTGVEHGTITIMLENEGFEVTTYRIDGEYLDSRHPESVIFTNSLKEDLSRRDFTINAMAYNENEGIIDFFGGQEDIKNKVIKCVGKAEERLEEDALRVMRALRFASVLGFKIERKTSNAIFEKSKKLDKVSKERINVELVKMLNGKGILHILLKYREVLSEIIPELIPMFDFKQNNKYHAYDVWEHTARVVRSCNNKNSMLRVAALLHDIGKPETYTEKNGVGHFYGHAMVSVQKSKNILKRLKFSTLETELVLLLVENHDTEFVPTKKSVLKFLNKFGEENLRLLMSLRVADIKGQGGKVDKDERLGDIYKTFNLLNTLELEKECFTLKQLAVNGNDLMKLGYKPSKELGQTLDMLLQKVINGEIENEKDKLLSLI